VHAVVAYPQCPAYDAANAILPGLIVEQCPEAYSPQVARLARTLYPVAHEQDLDHLTEQVDPRDAATDHIGHIDAGQAERVSDTLEPDYWRPPRSVGYSKTIGRAASPSNNSRPDTT